MTIKVAHLVYSFGVGGLEQVIVNLINHSQSANYDVEHVIISLVDVTDSYERLDDSIPIYTLLKREGKDLGSHLRFLRLLKTIKPDVLQTYNFGAIEYHYSAVLAGIKHLIHSEHGYGGDDSRGTSFVRNLIRKGASIFLDYYVVVSPDLYDWAKSVIGVSGKKLKLIYNGVDTDLFLPSEVKCDKFTICTIGRADPVKNQALLIESYNRACKERPGFSNESQLLIIGDGPIYDDLVDIVNELDIGSNVQLLGHRSDTAELLRGSHLFVLSSNYEAMPMTMLEAMSCALPVICTRVGGVEYMLSDNEGWLVPANDAESLSKALLYVFDNGRIASEKGENGKTLVRSKYGMDVMVKKYMDIYGCSNAQNIVSQN